MATKKSDQPHATGSCLCKSVQYTITSYPITSVICHCVNCRKSSGTAFMTNCAYPKTSVDIAPSSLSSIRIYKDTANISGAALSRHFCGNCGSPVFAESEKRPDVMIVTNGSLDDGGFEDEVLTPQVEYFCESKRGWMDGWERRDAMKPGAQEL